MTTEPMCGAAAFLRPGGPRQVPFKPCCAAAILHAARAHESSPPPCPRAELLGATAALFALTPAREVIP
jgi:hypothetical protein